MLELSLKLFIIAWLAVATALVWRLELRSRVVITPFVFTVYYFWLRFVPPYTLATELGLSYTLFSFLVGVTAVVLFLVGFVFGAYSGRAVRGSAYVPSELARNLPRSAWARMEPGFAFLALVLVGASLYFHQGIPDAFEAIMSQALGGGSSDLAMEVREARFELTKGAYFGGESRGQGLFSVLIELGWPVVVSFYLAAYSSTAQKRHLVMLLLSTAIALVIILGIGSRGPTLTFVMMVVAAYSLCKPLAFRAVVWSALAVVALAIAVGAFSTKMNYLLTDPGWHSIVRAVTEIVQRVALSNASNDVRVIELVHAGSWPLTWGGENLRNMITAIPGVNYGVPLSYSLFLEFNPNSRNTTFYSGSYMSTVYVDFAYAGVIVFYLLMGLVVGFGQRLYLRKIRSHPIILLSFAGPAFFVLAMILVSGFSSLVARTIVLATLLGIVVISSRIIRSLGGARTRAYRQI